MQEVSSEWNQVRPMPNNVKSSNFEVSVKNQDECMMCIGAGHVFSPVRDVTQIPKGRTWGVPSWGVGTGSPASLWDRGRATFSRSALGDWVEDRDTKGMPIARRSATTCKHTTRTSIIQVRRSSFHSLCYISDWSARQGQICMEQEHWPSWISFGFFILRVLIWVRETRNIFLDF